MIGSVSKVLIEAIRASQLADINNISVVIANDDGEGTVNTALPAIAVSVKDSYSGSGQYIGGLIQNKYHVQLAVMTALDNPSASPDKDFQYDQLDLSYKLMLYINKVQHTEFFRKLMVDFDFSLTYRGIETEQTKGMSKELGDIEVNIHRLQYDCIFVSKSIIEDREHATLESVEMRCGCNENTQKWQNQ